ncbi:glycosyltransferase family 61 protein [Mucilaginibacter puniceus]
MSIKSFFKELFIRFFKKSGYYYTWSQVPERAVNYGELPSGIDTLYSSYSAEIKRAKPVTWNGLIDHKFNKALLAAPFHNFVIQAKNWRVWGNQGAVITNNNYLFKDVSREFDNKQHSIFKQIKLKPITNIHKTTAILSASGSNVYYHWMFDVLPRINLLKQSGVFDSIDQFIIDYTDIPFQTETLAIAGIPLAKIVRSNNHWNFHIRADELVIPSLVSPNDVPGKEACLYLRSLFAKEIATGSSLKKIYIQRLSGRTIINETEILKILEPLNFEIVHPEKLTVKQQAKLFAGADFIIGPHGAGFTNIAFCKPGTRVIDMFAPEWINPCYWILAENLNLRYGYIIGENQEAITTENKGADINIDIEKLKILLNKINE